MRALGAVASTLALLFVFADTVWYLSTNKGVKIHLRDDATLYRVNSNNSVALLSTLNFQPSTTTSTATSSPPTLVCGALPLWV